MTEYMTVAEYKALRAKRHRKKRKRRGRGGKSKLEEKLAQEIALAGLPKPKREHRFHNVRKWRIDFAWPGYMLAAEVNGGTWGNGRHNRGSHIVKEYEKLNHLALGGWRVMLFSSDMVKDGSAVQYLIDFFEG